jgi:hypothetical protein
MSFLHVQQGEEMAVQLYQYVSYIAALNEVKNEKAAC